MPRRHYYARVVYFALACVTIAVGLLAHRGTFLIGADARDVLGDALWATMMLCWLSVLAPEAPLVTRGAAALGICVAVELSQLFHTPALDAVRRTTLGRLVLGTGFDPRDLVAYAFGVAVAMLLERVVGSWTTREI